MNFLCIVVHDEHKRLQMFLDPLWLLSLESSGVSDHFDQIDKTSDCLQMVDWILFTKALLISGGYLATLVVTQIALLFHCPSMPFKILVSFHSHYILANLTLENPVNLENCMEIQITKVRTVVFNSSLYIHFIAQFTANE